MHKAWMLSIVGAGVLQSTLRADIVLPANDLADNPTIPPQSDITAAFDSTNTSLSLTVGLDTLLSLGNLSSVGTGASAASLSAGLFGSAWAGGSILVAASTTLNATVFKYWTGYPGLNLPTAVAKAALPLTTAPVDISAAPPALTPYSGLHLSPIFTNTLNVNAAVAAAPTPSLTEAVTTPSSAEAIAIGAFDPKTHIQIGTVSNFFIALSPTLSPVPEPQSLALLGLGITVLAARRRPRPSA